MPKFRKKPLIVEALQLRWDNWSEMCEFAGVGPGESQPHGLEFDGDKELEPYDGNKKIAMTMLTPNGMVMAHEGDWILKDVEGAIYPCKRSVFEASYDPVDE